ncbi:hypothetical protein BD626DRAFT_576168 [Schizophyllum amplum]|uniref:Uncharacterized protein n=1 Tax=Schizophyllum amplum TaxID=97359 RepID=A0A550BTY7_9AGAR|nr:hypothetical protein BD626DRAFT_576168 [Auriculariopsis ampla]
MLIPPDRNLALEYLLSAPSTCYSGTRYPSAPMSTPAQEPVRPLSAAGERRHSSGSPYRASLSPSAFTFSSDSKPSEYSPPIPPRALPGSPSPYPSAPGHAAYSGCAQDNMDSEDNPFAPPLSGLALPIPPGALTESFRCLDGQPTTVDQLRAAVAKQSALLQSLRHQLRQQQSSTPVCGPMCAQLRADLASVKQEVSDTLRLQPVVPTPRLQKDDLERRHEMLVGLVDGFRRQVFGD